MIAAMGAAAYALHRLVERPLTGVLLHRLQGSPGRHKARHGRG
ncbi:MULTISPECIES: hypothetical protein [Streptomyces]